MIALRQFHLLLCLFCALPALAVADDQPFIDDHKILTGFSNFLTVALEDGSAASAKTLRAQLGRKKAVISLPDHKKPANFSYTEAIDSVAVLASIYKCPNCSRLHNSTATTWALTSDGVMASNYHVFEDTSRKAFGIITRKGEFFAVSEILAANKEGDVVLFRVKATTFPLPPLSLAQKDAPVSTSINVISHPDGRFFSYSSGKISRYYKKKSAKTSSVWMSITADYAKGSSGAPVMDDSGTVTGMVANTQTIYYKSKSSKKPEIKSNNPVQMVIKNCVPAHTLRALISN